MTHNPQQAEHQPASEQQPEGASRFGPAASKPHWGAMFYPAKKAKPAPTGIYGYLLYVPKGQRGPADFMANEAETETGPDGEAFDGVPSPSACVDQQELSKKVEDQAMASYHETGVWWPLAGEPAREQHWKHVAKLVERRADWVNGAKAEQERDWERRKKEITDFAHNPDPYGGLDGYVRARVGRAQCWAQVALGRKAVSNGAENLDKLASLERGLVEFLTASGTSIPPDASAVAAAKPELTTGGDDEDGEEEGSPDQATGEGGQGDGEAQRADPSGDTDRPCAGPLATATVGDERGDNDGNYQQDGAHDQPDHDAD